MGEVAFRGAKANTYNNSTGLNIPPPTSPAVVVGDLVLATIAVNSTAAVITAPAGWTAVGPRKTSGAHALYAFWAIHATALSYAFTSDLPVSGKGVATAYMGAKSAAPIHDAGSATIVAGAGANSMAAPAITTTVAGARAVSIFAALALTIGQSIGVPAGYTAESTTTSSSGTAPTVTVAGQSLPAAGSGAGGSGAFSGGATAPTDKIGWTLALEPSAEPWVRQLAGGAGVKAGDLLVLFGDIDGSGTIPTPAGYTAQYASGIVNANRFQVFTKTAAADGEAFGALTGASSQGNFVVANANGLRSVTSAEVQLTTTGTAPSATTVDGDLVLAVFHTQQTSTGTLAPTSTAILGQATVEFYAYARPAGGAASGTSTLTVSTGTNNVIRSVHLIARANNRPPTAPTLTAPNGGEVVNNSTTVTWTAGADPDADALTYELDYSTNNGAAWTAITASASGTSYAWNTSAVPSSTAVLVRIRAKDPSGLVSAYDQSNAVFTVQHNVAPTAATGLTPDGGTTVDRNSVQRLSWTYNDADVGDSQSKADWRWRVGVGAWTTTTVVTTNPYVDVAGGTFPAGTVEWQVLTYDALGVVATGWSASAFFTAATAPAAPAITAPANNSAQGAPTGVISWSAPSQDAYQVRKVADNAGAPNTAVVYSDTGTVVSTTARNAALDFPTNNRTEHLQVRIRVAGLWSTWASVKVNVAWSPPAVPVLLVTPQPALAAIDVVATNPAPVNPQPAVASTELWRRVVGSGSAGERLVVAVVGGIYRDVTPASGVAYEYQAVAIGVTGTKQASAWTP